MLLLLAFALGFVGYLPLGNINLTVLQLSMEQQKRHWQTFIAFAALMEFIYCYACISGLELLRRETQLIVMFNWSAVIIFLLLGIFTFTHTETVRPDSRLSPGVKRGILLAVFNPLQIPFWMVWGVYMMQNGWLQSSAISIALFSFICALGAASILYIYALAGKKVVEKLNVNGNILNRFIGSIFILLAVYETIKIIYHL